MLPLSIKTIERFNSKVNKLPGLGPNGDCWFWVTKSQINGYGYMSIKCIKTLSTHISIKIARNEDVPNKMQVLHSCDTPQCVNPGHLRVGTNKENVHDAVAKGRVQLSDFTNQRFGSLVYRKIVGNSVHNGCNIGLADCDCGGTTKTQSSLVKRKKMCWSCSRNSKSPKLLGARFGNLTVQYKVIKHSYNRPIGLWNCLCDCGKEVIATTYMLQSGKRFICGVGCSGMVN